MSAPATFLPGVAAEHVLARLAKAGGDEIGSGKLASPVSSAALAVNVFGWFTERPHLLPPFPGLPLDAPPIEVEVEHCARFPWRGGRHPWLDALVRTPAMHVGVESKRFEPFRDAKRVALSDAYWRHDWGAAMAPWTRMRDALRDGLRFTHLDAAQLVKHAFGLATDAARYDARPALVYLFAEPTEPAELAPTIAVCAKHREEIVLFATQVAGGAVAFHACSWREWLATWQDGEVGAHARAVRERFAP